MKIIEKYNKIQEIDTTVTLPWKVWTTFYETIPYVDILGDQISFGGDYKSLQEIRESLEYLVDQFGGKVEWSKK